MTRRRRRRQNNGNTIYKVGCPHCNSVARFVNSRVLTPIYREYTFRCENPMCGFVFGSQLEHVKTLSPSAMPNPIIRLPLSTHNKKGCVIVQLNQDDFTPKPKEEQGELDV